MTVRSGLADWSRTTLAALVILGCTVGLAPAAFMGAAVLIAAGPAIAVALALHFIWRRSWRARWIALGMLLTFALYGIATISARIHMGRWI